MESYETWFRDQVTAMIVRGLPLRSIRPMWLRAIIIKVYNFGWGFKMGLDGEKSGYNGFRIAKDLKQLEKSNY